MLLRRGKARFAPVPYVLVHFFVSGHGLSRSCLKLTVSLVTRLFDSQVPFSPSHADSASELIHAASWHDRFPGEIRVQLDLARLATFYDTQLAPSLVPIRAGQERWHHRVQNVGKICRKIEMTRPEGSSSGINRAALIQIIIDRYAQRLKLVRYLLRAPTTDPDDILGLANKTDSASSHVDTLSPALGRSSGPARRD